MQTIQNYDLQKQIEEASKRAKNKKAFYLYDEAGNREFLGVFGKKNAEHVKKYYRAKNVINRLIEFEVRTTLPDSSFSF